MHLRDNMVKSILIVTVLSILGKITGFMRETVIAAYYGAGGVTDAFFVAFSLPPLLFFVIGASMGVIFIPMYAQQLKEKPEDSHSFVSNIINMILLVSLLSSIIGVTFSEYILKLIAPRLLEKSLTIASALTRIMFPMFIFIGLSYIMTGVLQSHESFVVPSLVSIPSNLIIVLGTVLFSKKYSIYALAWATLIGAISQLLVQIPAVAKKIKYRFYIDFNQPYVLSYWKLIIPVIIGTTTDKINIMVDNMIASSLMPGSISAINYSTKLLDFADSVAIGAIIAVVYPKLAKMGAQKDYKRLGNISYNAVISISQIILPIIAIIVILNEEIVRLIFQRGAFGTNETKLIAYVLVYYAIGLWGISMGGVLSRVFYSLENTSTPMKISIAALICNVVLNLLLVRQMGIRGLGLATSLSGTLGALAFLYFTRKMLDSFNIMRILKEMFKIGLAVLCMLYTMILFRRHITIDNFYMNLMLIAAAGSIIYVILSWILGIGLVAKIKPSKEYQDITDIKRYHYDFHAPVSAIIHCHMYKNTIERAVFSVWNQTWRPKELILVGDSGLDHGTTKNGIHSIINRYPREWLKVVYLNKNVGLVSGRNIGRWFATQKFIAFLEADDAWHPQKIEIQLMIMLKNPYITICAHDYDIIKSSRNSIYSIYTKEYIKRIEIKSIKSRKNLIFDQLPASSIMMKNRHLDQPFLSGQYYSEDYLLWLAMILLGCMGIKINMPLYYIYAENHGTGLTKKLWKIKKEEVNTYRILWAKEFLSFFSLILFEIFSYIKYVKRLAIQGIINVIRSIR